VWTAAVRVARRLVPELASERVLAPDRSGTTRGRRMPARLGALKSPVIPLVEEGDVVASKRATFVQTLRAQWLGQRMREIRDDRGLTLKHVAQYLGVEFSTLARYERAEWPFRAEHVTALLSMYGVHDEQERTRLVQLATDAWWLDRWDRDTLLPKEERPFIDVAWLQDRAVQMHVYCTGLLPPMLRTREYHEAVLRRIEMPSAPDHEIAHRMRTWSEQTRTLLARRGVRLVVALEESVLSRPVGMKSALSAQLAHLLELVRLPQPDIELRILPTTAGLHVGASGPFAVFHQPQPYPPVAVVDHLGGRLFIESNAERYVSGFTELLEAAASGSESLEAITTAELELRGRLAGAGVAA
jgi:transcriptional regulator with XRE-family HTH domain